MLDVISFLFLSILAVVAAVFGIGMAGEDKKKPYDVKTVGSFKAPKKKVSEGAKAIGAAVGVGAWIKAFAEGSDKGLLYDVLHAETERKKALKDPSRYLYETASPGVQNLVRTTAGMTELYRALLKRDSGNSFPSIYEKLLGSAEKGQKAFDSPLDYGDDSPDITYNSITKEDVNDIFSDIVNSGAIPKNSRANVKLVHTSDKEGKPQYRGRNDGEGNINIEQDIYKDPSMNKAAQKYALIEELFHIKYKSELEAKSRMHEYLLKNTEKYIDVIVAALQYNKELNANKMNASQNKMNESNKLSDLLNGYKKISALTKYAS